MKTKLSYVVIPCVLMAGFLAYFVPANARIETRLRGERRLEQEQKEADEARRREREQLARDEAEARARERAAAEVRRLAAREAAQREQDEKLRDLRQRAEAEREELRAEVVQLEQTHAAAQEQRRQLEVRNHAARREVEILRIERRSLDLELQRSTEVLAERVAAGVITEAPLFPAPRRNSNGQFGS